MSGKLFGQIIALMIIFALIMIFAKCLARNYCPLMKCCKPMVSDSQAMSSSCGSMMSPQQ